MYTVTLKDGTTIEVDSVSESYSKNMSDGTFLSTLILEIRNGQQEIEELAAIFSDKDRLQEIQVSHEGIRLSNFYGYQETGSISKSVLPTRNVINIVLLRPRNSGREV